MTLKCSKLTLEYLFYLLKCSSSNFSFWSGLISPEEWAWYRADVGVINGEANKGMEDFGTKGLKGVVRGLVRGPGTAQGIMIGLWLSKGGVGKL